MKLVIDLQGCQSGSRLGGIGRYSLQLAKAMVRQAGSHDIWLLLNNNLPEPILSIRNEFVDLLPQNRIITFESIDRVSEFYTSGSFRTRAAELVREDFIARLNPDFVFISSLFEGLGDDVVTSVGNIAGSHHTAVTLYDLIPLVKGDIYLSGKEIETAHYMRKLESLKRSDLLLAISEFSRDEGRRLLDFPAQRTINISTAVSDYFRPLELSKAEMDEIRVRFGIRNKFLMYASSYDPRKNQAMLIEAFAMLPRQLRKEFQLVLVGNGWDEVYNSLRSHMRSNGLKESDVIFTGYIDDDTLLKLYNICHLFVFPSLFEGFGIPILEAMCCGIPAIGSNSTSIPEVVGRDDALFDPASARSISSKISQALNDRNFYESLCQHAVAHSKKFSWDNSARKAIKAMEDFISSSSHSTRIQSLSSQATSEIDSGRRSQLIHQLALIPGAESENDGTLLELSSAIAANEYFLNVIKAAEKRKRHTKDQEYVGVVTTWNTKCNIAAYAKHLMSKFIGNYCVFAPYADELTEPDEDFVSRCWNSAVTSDADSLSGLLKEIDHKKVTGVLIQFNYDLFDFDSLANLIDSQLRSNRSVYIEFHSIIDQSDPGLNNKLLMLVPSLKRCNKLLVHSQKDIDKLQSLGLIDNIVLFPQGVLDIDTSEPKPGPNKAGIKDSRDLWLRPNTFTNMSSFLYSIVSCDRAFNREYRVAQYFSPGDGCIKTMTVKLNGSNVLSGGEEGLLLYGPYITLTPGLYHIDCFGNVLSNAADKGYELKLCHANGGQKIESDDVEIDNGKNGLLFHKRFYIDRKVDNFEVQIIAKNKHNLTIDGYIISRNRVKR